MSDIDQTVDTEASALKPVAATWLRDAIKLGGLYLTLHGAATSSQVTLWGGLIMTLGGVLWSTGVSWYKHWLLMRARRIAGAYSAHMNAATYTIQKGPPK